jgi:hypothetical protein
VTVAQVGGQFRMLAKGSIGADSAPENDAGPCHGRGDGVRIVAFLCGALVDEIAVRAPSFQSSFHRWSGNRKVEETQRSLVGPQFSRHDASPHRH